MGCRKIMVIDDDKSIRDGVIEALEFEGYGVYSACNGRDALDKLLSMSINELPGCIFLDIRMPVMDGFTFLDEIEHSPRELAQIPVCITSANVDLREALNHPAVTETIRKPMDIEKLYESAHKYCGTPD